MDAKSVSCGGCGARPGKPCVDLAEVPLVWEHEGREARVRRVQALGPCYACGEGLMGPGKPCRACGAVL